MCAYETLTVGYHCLGNQEGGGVCMYGLLKGAVGLRAVTSVLGPHIVVDVETSV